MNGANGKGSMPLRICFERLLMWMPGGRESQQDNLLFENSRFLLLYEDVASTRCEPYGIRTVQILIWGPLRKAMSGTVRRVPLGHASPP